jgi:hypothetical protein
LGIEAWLPLTPELAFQYSDGAITISLGGSFVHTGILGDKMKVTQPFSGRIICGKQRQTVFEPEVDMNPETEQEERERRQREYWENNPPYGTFRPD